MKNYTVDYFNCTPNLDKYVDSILFSSDTVIASISITSDDGRKVDIDLMVRGDVDIEYKGDTYRDPVEFPDELKNLIKNDPLWTFNDYIYISDNNWFEYIYTFYPDKDNDKVGYSDGILFDGDLSKYTEEILKDDMIEIATEILNRH